MMDRAKNFVGIVNCQTKWTQSKIEQKTIDSTNGANGHDSGRQHQTVGTVFSILYFRP